MQISELKEADKVRLYRVIDGFLFDNDEDIITEQNKEKVTIANKCPHCKSTKTRKKGHQYDVQRFICNDCKKNLGVSTVSLTKELLKVYILICWQDIALKNVQSLQEFVSRHFLISGTKFYPLWVNFKRIKCCQEYARAMKSLLSYQNRAIKNQKELRENEVKVYL